jgi:SRSO17 transposase
MLVKPTAPKQDHALKQLPSKLSFHIEEYYDCFQTETSNSLDLGQAYIQGLFKTEAGKRNMERLNEELDLSGNGYQRIQHFITNSTWSAQRLIEAIARKTSDLYTSQDTYRLRDVGYIIDESAHLKKGKHSVGVARQYAGLIGKVENCQVGVYASLVWNSHSSLINERLFLPKEWTTNPKRCHDAGIPEDQRLFKTKPQLAIEMIKADLEAGVQFSWVGGDGLYGHGFELGKALDNMQLTFLLDIHSNQNIYLSEPVLSVPEPTSKRGAKPTKRRADTEPMRVDVYAKEFASYTWPTVTIRDGTKGPLTLSIHTRRVWIWDGESERATERVLVITQRPNSSKLKYSLSNVDYTKTPLERLAYMQAQRYWVERAFQEAKSELGMSDYQVRKWDAWHRHMALVMLALAFLVKERILYKQDYPLLSSRDIRLMIIAMLLNDPAAVDKRIQQLEARHKQRRRDIERYDKTEAIK